MARVLIVDDEESIRDLIKEVLIGQGHQFELAADGRQALRILRRKAIDLAIVDRNMPGMTGIEVVKSIRQDPRTAAMKILMCTAGGASRESEEAFAAGADDYILKPLSLALLRDKVAWALTHRA